MAAVAGPQTPQRPIPGGYQATPAQPQGATIFAQNAASLRQNPQAPAADSTVGRPAPQEIKPIERAARSINETLLQESRFPELESYITQGTSGDYEMPTNPAWLPFQKLKMHDLPQRIIEQCNQSDISISMGVFPELSHAWVVLDNCLYLWDYTMPNPDLIGYEDSPAPIVGVKLVMPKAAVFVKEIQHLIVVATQSEMLLLGVATQATSTGAKTIALYNTRMSISVRGMQVRVIEASKKTGRIFFTGRVTDDIYEFQYQQEEGWFRGKTQRICHTRSQYDYVPDTFKAVGQWLGPWQERQILQLIIDDTRDLMYTLGERSEIKVWAIKDQLRHALARPLPSLLQNIGHFTARTDLLHGRDVQIESLSVIPATEAAKLSVLATTNTGCRMYISCTRGYGYQADGNNPPTSMQILHIRFPPMEASAAPSLQPSQPGQMALQQYSSLPAGSSGAMSSALHGLFMGYRIPPGYFMGFKDIENAVPRKDRIFCSAPDFARLKNPTDTSALSTRFAEFGQWIDMPSQCQQVRPLMPESLGATNAPTGFGNELTLQFDRTSTEIAVMTSTGVQTIRRRRLVDVFAGMMRYASTDEEGRDGDIKRFVRMYGRGETAATALAVACGQGLDVSPDSRVSAVTDPDVIEGARKAFIDHGGKPDYNANAVIDNGAPIDNVRPSPRHEGLALYISRLIRSIWRVAIIKEVIKPGEPPRLVPGVQLEKLRSVQRDLNTLAEFLDRNKSFIEGLAGPQALGRVNNRQEEIALQGEHRAMSSMVQLIASIVEGISFVLVLYDERLEDILAALSDVSRQRARELTFEGLFVSTAGRDLAKELVKAIVNRNIASGSNVDTVAEALRRRCGSFCSADDVVIFKAQEQVKRASEAGSQSETSRVLLNESQRLFQKVAGSLSMEHLQWAVEQYVSMSFYAGAIQLCLVVAQEKDRARRALTWVKDGMPDNDGRKDVFEARKRCYDLIFATIQHLDHDSAQAADTLDGRYTTAAKRKNEAYDVVNNSDDAVFQTCLYDWYVEIGQADRLLEIDSRYVVDYLKRRGQQERHHADLLWRYYVHHNDYLQAAAVQLDLARGYFDLNLEERIEYLSRARTNASTRQIVLMDSRQSKQQLLREISDLLDVANIQDDILQRMKGERRLNEDRRPQVLAALNGSILPIDELYNQYADQAEYNDICLLIFQVAEHRNPADIKSTWDRLIQHTEDEAVARQDTLPWEAIGIKVREMGRKLNTSDSTFPLQELLPMLERYQIGAHEHHPPPTWAVDIFLDLEIPCETLLPVLEQLYYANAAPFTGSKRKLIATHMVYLLGQWVLDSERRGDRIPCGSEENASLVQDCLASLVRGRDLDAASRRDAEGLAARVAQAMR